MSRHPSPKSKKSPPSLGHANGGNHPATVPTAIPSSTRPRQAAIATAVALLLQGLTVAGTMIAATQPVWAQTAESRQSFNIPSGTLDQTLNRFASAANVELSIDAGLTRGKTSSGLVGAYSVAGGFAEILRGHGLTVIRAANGAYAVRASAAVEGSVLPAVEISDSRIGPDNDAAPNALPKVYAGGQVAKGGRLGILGNKDVMDTPFNTASYTEQLILNQQARNISDVLSNNPSVRITYPDNDGSTDLVVRGNKIAALDMSYDGLYGIGSAGIESLERVEFLSGANALLNGLGTIGGVGGMVNQVPKKALETPLTRVTGTYMSSSQFGGQIDLSRRFGDDNQFGIRINAAYRDGNADARNQSNKVGTATVALDYRNTGLRLSTNFGYRHNDSESPARTLFAVAGFKLPAPPSDPKATWQQRWSYDITDTTFGTVRGEYDITPDLTVYAALGGSRYEQRQLFSNTALLNANGDILQRQVYWPLYRNSVSAETGVRGMFHTGDIKHNWNLTTSVLNVTNGIALNTLSQNTSNIYNPVYIQQPNVSALPGPGNIPKTGDSNLSGVAFADTLGFIDDRIQLTLGIREQKVEAKAYSAAGAITSNYNKSAVTYAAGVVVKPMPNLSLYSNYIEGLQQGPVAPVGSANAGAVFSPYVSKQYEVGAKYDFGRFLTTLSVYQLSTPNGQTNATTLVYNVDGEQRTQGIELNTYGELTTGVRLLGGLALVDARQTQTVGGLNNGKKVTGAADTTMNLGLEWDPAALPGLTLSGRAIYTSKQYLDNANLQSIPSWVRYDLGVRYKTVLAAHPMTIRFNVENVFNKSYWAEAVQTYLVQSRPRTFLLSASVDM